MFLNIQSMQTISFCVVQHVKNQYKGFCLLQPTAPKSIVQVTIHQC
jgi:hypothetical protein